ncbi:RNA polymerase sigma factor [Frigoriglobus tundricola]|uniref:RNA polymerase sigma-70 region 2 domain-containing protein n=1 Tax=Frigoriglobus tundricola TaxID=2774151 RepID=A0A6M5YY41_9BACT|nr:sigma-70 family RNA polymerase sigma factor [Frigoriglobus tundricola]QJW98434.1 hypothetical protein FTUN_6024 [Frigoriglobus tundricola]
MTPHDELKALLARLQQGDAEAAAVLCEKYRDIAVTVLARLAGTQAGRTVSISEVVQSGMVQVLTHLDELVEGVGNLPGYLRAMARNKLRDRLDKLRAGKRDISREEYGEAALDGLGSADPTASDAVGLDEEYEAVMRSLSDPERTLVEARIAGHDWETVAELSGQTSAEAARKQFERLIQRLREEHGSGDAA